MISEILGILLPSVLSFAYFYLTELFLILIILPIIILIATLRLSISNKAKIFISIFNMIYSLLLPQIISKLLLIIKLLIIIIFLNYKIILNNMYMVSYFSIFSSILVEIYRNIGAFIVIYVVISILMIILYGFNVTHNFKEYINNNKKNFLIKVFLSFILGPIIIGIILTTNSESYIRLYFLITSLITAISQYILQFNQKNIKNIFNTLLSDDLVGLIIPWSFLLELIFLELKQPIEYYLHTLLGHI
jgi:hypothetical protein